MKPKYSGYVCKCDAKLKEGERYDCPFCSQGPFVFLYLFLAGVLLLFFSMGVISEPESPYNEDMKKLIFVLFLPAFVFLLLWFFYLIIDRWVRCEYQRKNKRFIKKEMERLKNEQRTSL